MSLDALLFFSLAFFGAFLVAFHKLERGLYVMVFTAPFMDVFKTDAFGVNLRASEVIPLGVLLALAIRVAMGRARFRTRTGMQLLCVALLLGITLSLVANAASAATLMEDEQGSFSLQSPTMVGIKTLIHAVGCVLAFLAASSISSDERVLTKAVKVMIVSSALVCVWSLLNLVGLWSGVHSLGYTPQNIWLSPQETRIRGTLDEPSYFANYLGLMLPLAFFCWIARRRLFSAGVDRAILGLLGITLMLTFSAGGWFLLTLFMVMVPALARIYGYRLGHGMKAVAALAVLGSIVIGFVNEFVDPNYGRMVRSLVYDKLGQPTSSTSGGARVAMSRIGLAFFWDSPLFGIGPNMVHFRWMERVREDELEIIRFVGPGGGSMWTYHAAELGLVGLLPIAGIFAASLAMTARAASRCRDKAMRPILVGLFAGLIACCIHYIAHETLWWPYVWIYLGLAAGATRSPLSVSAARREVATTQMRSVCYSSCRRATST